MKKNTKNSINFIISLVMTIIDALTVVAIIILCCNGTFVIDAYSVSCTFIVYLLPFCIGYTIKDYKELISTKSDNKEDKKE